MRGVAITGLPKVAANIFSGFVWVAFVWLGINIKAVFVVFVAGRFYFFESAADFCFHFIEQGGLEDVAQKIVVEISLFTPQPTIANSAFRNQAMDMGVPFQVPAECMEDADETGGEKFRFVVFVEHAQDNTLYGRKKAA